MTKEIYNNLLPEVAFDLQEIASDTTTAGNIIDRAGFNEGILFSFLAGSLTGSQTILLEESDDAAFTTSNVVADINIVPVNVAGVWYATGQEDILKFVPADANSVKNIGVVDTKRYLRPSIVSADTTTSAFIGAIVHKVGNIKSVYGL